MALGALAAVPVFPIATWHSLSVCVHAVWGRVFRSSSHSLQVDVAAAPEPRFADGENCCRRTPHHVLSVGKCAQLLVVQLSVGPQTSAVVNDSVGFFSGKCRRSFLRIPLHDFSFSRSSYD